MSLRVSSQLSLRREPSCDRFGGELVRDGRLLPFNVRQGPFCRSDRDALTGGPFMCSENARMKNDAWPTAPE